MPLLPIFIVVVGISLWVIKKLCTKSPMFFNDNKDITLEIIVEDDVTEKANIKTSQNEIVVEQDITFVHTSESIK